MLVVRVIGGWLWLLIGSAVPTMLIGLVTGHGISSDYLTDYYAHHLTPALVILLICLAVLIPIGRWFAKHDPEFIPKER